MHPNDTALNDYVDGSLAAAEQAGVEQHLTGCAACRQTVEDLRDLVGMSRELDALDPPVRAWSRLERAIRLEREHAGQASGARGVSPGARGVSAGARGVSAGARGVSAGARGFQPSGSGGHDARLKGSRSVWLAGLAAAAALLLAAMIGMRSTPARHDDAPAGASAALSAGEAVQSIETELRQAESHYENAIKGLEVIANSEQSELDPRTAATLQKNLAVIDQAISESRAAVRSQPASEPAQQSLIEGFKTKIGLLQDTVALINEMRKGNEAGAARIASGLKQKGT